MSEASRPQALVTREAAHWHAQQREAELDAAQRRQFMDWLVASPLHLREYLAVGRAAAGLAELLREEPLDLEALLASPPPDNVVALPLRAPARPAPCRRRPPTSALAALAAGVACLALASWAGWPRSQSYLAAQGRPLRIELADHSMLHLNGDSEAEVRIGWLTRRIVLRRGQASFVVAADRRPLEVLAGGLRVRDIGTTFDIDLLDDHARIGVSEGRVRIDAGPVQLADLQAGQSARIDYGSHRVAVRGEDDAGITAWWQGRLVFRDQPLGEVAQRFNRINPVPLRIDDPRAGALRLTGNLRGNDLRALRAFLERQPGLRVEDHAGALHVASAP